MNYRIVLTPSDDGYAASVPELPGCHSQGETEAEAMDNIRDAIDGYLEVASELCALGNSPGLLERMALEGIAEHERGETLPLSFDLDFDEK